MEQGEIFVAESNSTTGPMTDFEMAMMLNATLYALDGIEYSGYQGGIVQTTNMNFDHISDMEIFLVDNNGNMLES